MTRGYRTSCRLLSTHEAPEINDASSDEIPETKHVYTAQLDPDVEKAMNEGQQPWEHPGRRKIGTQEIPGYLELAAKRAISRHLTQTFREDVIKMKRRIYHLELPEEPEDVIRRKREATEKVIANEPNVDLRILTDDEKSFVMEKRKAKIERTMAAYVPTWKEMQYDDYKSHVYLGGRLAPNYTALKYVMNEIKIQDPTFQPKTLFDFGSGVGTTMFAANDVWPHSLSEHFNVDISPSMNELSTFLLRGGKDTNPMIYNGVYHREYLPLSSNIKYDLVVSAFSLMELPSRKARIQAIESLWQKTHDLLVILETGTKPGFTVINEVRSLILDMTGHQVTNSFYEATDSFEVKEYDWRNAPSSHILAPCSHHMTCPRMFTGGPILCNFKVAYQPLDIGQRDKNIEEERFCYIVLRKGPPNSQKQPWPRINQEVLKRSGHTICRMCCPDGGQKSVTFTKTKHKGHLYQVAKCTKWGDLFPAVILDKDQPLSFWDKLKRQRRREQQSGNNSDQDY